MAAGKKNFLPIGGKVTAGGFAYAWADSHALFVCKIHGEDLVKGVARFFFFRLKNDVFRIRREVSLARSYKFRS